MGHRWSVDPWLSGTLDLAVALAPSSVSSFQLEIDGQSFFPRILDDIRAARTSVHIAEYGFKPGQLADELVPILQDKARQGVPVRMVVDRFGSSVDFESKGIFDQLVGAGVQVVQNDAALIDRDGLLGGDRWIDWRFDELGRIDHRKLFVIDGRIGWVGGAGIEDHFLNGTLSRRDGARGGRGGLAAPVGLHEQLPPAGRAAADGAGGHRPVLPRSLSGHDPDERRAQRGA